MTTIQYGISTQRFSRFEPALHAISILVPLSLAVFYTVGGYMAPRGPSCFPRGLLPICSICFILAVCFIICIISMSGICWAVISRAMKMKKYTNFGKKNKSAAQKKSSQSRVNEEKIQTIVQALLYASAFILTYSAGSISSFYTRGRADASLPFVIEALIKILYPLQGFWNFVFYTRPRVKKLMESNPHRSRLAAILEVIFKPESTENVHKKPPALGRATIPEFIQPKGRKIITDSHTMSPLFHTNDQNSDEISSRRVLNNIRKNCDKSEAGTQDMVLPELQWCHQQDGKSKGSSTHSAVVEGEEGYVEILDGEDTSRMNTDTVQNIGNEGSYNDPINHHESVVCGTSMLPTDLDDKFDSVDAVIPTSCRIKTDEVSTFEEDIKNQSQMWSQPRAKQRVSLVNIGSIFSEEDIANLDGYFSSDDS